MDVKPGDIVTLRSGGATMTVESIIDGQTHCVWQVDVGGGRWETRREVFPPTVLSPATPIAQQAAATEDVSDYKVYEEGDD